jgi:hypothetical protein
MLDLDGITDNADTYDQYTDAEMCLPVRAKYQTNRVVGHKVPSPLERRSILAFKTAIEQCNLSWPTPFPLPLPPTELALAPPLSLTMRPHLLRFKRREFFSLVKSCLYSFWS